MASPYLLRASLFSQHRPGEPGPLEDSQITSSDVPADVGAWILAALLVVRASSVKADVRLQRAVRRCGRLRWVGYRPARFIRVNFAG